MKEITKAGLIYHIDDDNIIHLIQDGSFKIKTKDNAFIRKYDCFLPLPLVFSHEHNCAMRTPALDVELEALMESVYGYQTILKNTLINYVQHVASDVLIKVVEIQRRLGGDSRREVVIDGIIASVESGLGVSQTFIPDYLNMDLRAFLESKWV